MMKRARLSSSAGRGRHARLDYRELTTVTALRWGLPFSPPPPSNNLLQTSATEQKAPTRWRPAAILGKQCRCEGGAGLEKRPTVTEAAQVLDIKTTLEPKIDILRNDMGLMREDHKKLKARVESTESSLACLRPSVAYATARIRALQKEVAYLRWRADDQAVQARHNNVRIVAFQKK
ncbi:hypothetical protein NDU88_000254 [Pleurodeles waltl]|uniref:Uncharacterized protein n=1 Tax=Pleurodeles waltl TaxID=8319 RepID=A0AAV7KNG6_PLEWA|nr:hypothetical protein NDU88_000254 [Pleurodeles waltl]